MLCVVESFISVKKGVKFGRGSKGVGGRSDVCKSPVVFIFGRRGGGMDLDAENGSLGEGKSDGGRREGDIGAGLGEVEEICRGGSLPGRGGVGIEASADIVGGLVMDGAFCLVMGEGGAKVEAVGVQGWRQRKWSR